MGLATNSRATTAGWKWRWRSTLRCRRYFPALIEGTAVGSTAGQRRWCSPPAPARTATSSLNLRLINLARGVRLITRVVEVTHKTEDNVANQHLTCLNQHEK